MSKKLSEAHWAKLLKGIKHAGATNSPMESDGADNSPGKRDESRARMNALVTMIKKFAAAAPFDRRIYNGEEQPQVPNCKDDTLPEDRLAAAIGVTRDCLRAHELLIRQCEHFVDDAIKCLENARSRQEKRMKF